MDKWTATYIPGEEEVPSYAELRFEGRLQAETRCLSQAQFDQWKQIADVLNLHELEISSTPIRAIDLAAGVGAGFTPPASCRHQCAADPESRRACGCFNDWRQEQDEREVLSGGAEIGDTGVYGSDADRTLVAAAPDLLEALKGLLTAARQIASQTHLPGCTYPEIQAAEAALAKAEGRG